MLFVTPPKIVPAEFLSPTEAEKTAGVHLMSPPSQWDDEITQALIREHPYVPADQIVVSFRQKDDTNGYALGNIGFASMPHIFIPVIITNRELSPLDVMVVSRGGTGSNDVDQAAGDMTEDRVMPLTEENFDMAQDQAQLGHSVPDQDVKGVGYTEDGFNMRLPFRGRTVVASLLGASETQKAALGDILSTNKQAAAGFALNSTMDVVESWLNAGAPTSSIQAKFAAAPVPLGAALVAGEDLAPRELKTAEMFAESVVVDGGIAKTAVKVDVVDLASPEKGLSPLLVFSDGSFCRAPEKVATVHDGSTSDQRAAEIVSKLASPALTRGSYLMFQIDQHFTRPAKLASIEARDDQRAVTLRLEDDLARGYNVILDRRVKVAAHVDGTWVLPMVSKVFQLTGSAEDQPMAAAKVAEWFERRVPDQLVVQDGQYSLSIRGEAFGTPTDETKMAALLGSWITNAEQVIKLAKESGHVRFDSPIPATVANVVKMAENLKNLPKLASAAVAELRMPLDLAVKLASSIGNPQAADMVLGTGFLTEDNLAEFTSMGDELEEVVEKLARLLLAIRMGFPGDESATVVAMKSLQRVKERLEAAMTEVRA